MCNEIHKSFIIEVILGFDTLIRTRAYKKQRKNKASDNKIKQCVDELLETHLRHESGSLMSLCGKRHREPWEQNKDENK